jgi:hypothetical protein
MAFPSFVVLFFFLNNAMTQVVSYQPFTVEVWVQSHTSAHGI